MVNAAAPTVWFVGMADGDRLTAWRETEVRVDAADADEIALVVDGVPAWDAPGTSLAGPWTPEPGRHRLVAVASREGAPDALAAIEIDAVPPPGAAPVATAPGAAGAAPPAAGAGPAVGDARSAARPPGRAETAPSAPPPSSASPDGGADGAGGDGRDGARGPLAALLRFLGDPERMAWTVAFPLLLILAAVAYALLQRFIDGGQKLAWRGRGPADDVTIEF